ncbi:cytospin-A-like [Gigantopelta aegis]|uniref:cytospin-A-like n=1 Tax=Gigantopelta aegis TaxID=1735272 RepID=UPI001B8873ED|nr:cytospin-A-like [Gigantopelta aegis]
MKKAKTSVQKSSSDTCNVPEQSSMKVSNSDSAALSSGGNSKNVLKTAYLSKSQENLSSSSGLAKKKIMSSAGPKGSTSEIFRKSSAKSAVVLREKPLEKNITFVKPKVPKVTSSMRKASSTQSIDKTGATTSGGAASTSKGQYLSNKSQAMKRAQSSQNVSKDKFTRKRTSAPADVMAYNAELLANFEKDKKNLEARISELTKITENRKADIEMYKYEIKAFKDKEKENDDELDLLRSQNRKLREQLDELGIPIEPITDTEKLSLLKKCGSSSRSGTGSDSHLPTSVSCDSLGNRYGTTDRSASVTPSETSLSLGDLCGTPDHPSVLSLDPSNWDKQSCKSRDSDGLSEISVACLTERILRMEETNYSTTEELQATLQELGDLQDAVNELTDENERLTDEKSVLLESLCTQTQKLSNSRIQVEQLKCLMLSGSLPDKSDREVHLLDLLKSAQEEKEEMIRKQTELANHLHTVDVDFCESQDVVDALRDKLHLFECQLNSYSAEKELSDQHKSEMKELIANQHIDINHLKTLLENEKAKFQDLQQLHKAEEKTDLEALLVNVRQEKAQAEENLANVQESLAHSQCEVAKLKEMLLCRDEEIKATKNNAKMQITSLEYKVEKHEADSSEMKREIQILREHIDQLEQDCDHYVQQNKTNAMTIASLQDELRSAREQKAEAENQLVEFKSKYQDEYEDWRQFQKDLQVAVVIANDFRTETQQSMEQMISENTSLKETIHSLENKLAKQHDELEILRCQKDSRSKILTSAELKGKVLSTVDKELSVLRETQRLDAKSQSLSVKTLIQSLEEQIEKKSACSSIHTSHNNSPRNSLSADIDDSLSAVQELLKSSASAVSPQHSPCDAATSPQPEFQLRSLLRKPAEKSSPLQRHSSPGLCFPDSLSPVETKKTSHSFERSSDLKVSPAISSILQRRETPRRNSGPNHLGSEADRKDSMRDPLAALAKQMGGTKRNALLKWCQQKTVMYSGVDITNFSSSWNDGLAFCAIFHSYIPHKIPYKELTSEDKKRNFTLAFEAGESVGIHSSLNIKDMVCMERPEWQAVMNYCTAIYKHFEIDGHS